MPIPTHLTLSSQGKQQQGQKCGVLGLVIVFFPLLLPPISVVFFRTYIAFFFLPWESYFYFKSNGICRKANFTHTMNLYLHIIISKKYEGIHGTETIINLFLISSCKLGSNSVERLIKKK